MSIARWNRLEARETAHRAVGSCCWFVQFSISALCLTLAVVIVIVVIVIIIIIIITIIIIISISIIIDSAAVNRDNQVDIEIKKQSFVYFRGKTSRKYFYLKGLMI